MFCCFLCCFVQFTVIDAGYTATDYALTILFNKPECRYISVSNADNAYGSHIVETVLKGEPSKLVCLYEWNPSMCHLFARFIFVNNNVHCKMMG